MKQDKLLCIIFTFIGLYLIGNAIFLFTLNMHIAFVSAIGLFVLALIFLYFALKFYKLSKKDHNLISLISDNISDIEEFETINSNDQENNQIDVDHIIETDNKKEKIAIAQNKAIVNETTIEKEKIEKELSELKQQQLLNKVKLMKIIFDENAQKTAMNKFIAIDLKTSGCDKDHDSIMGIDAVLFEYGKPVKAFNSLVNPIRATSKQATNINQIDGEMGNEKEILEDLLVFLSDAIKKQTFLCTYNAEMIISFLEDAFRRNNMDVDMYYVDTLTIAKEHVEGLANYNLNTVANHFNIISKEEYCASSKSKAEVCGNILVKILKRMYS